MEKSNNGKSLHAIPNNNTMNPYQQAMSIMTRTLEPFDADHQIPVFGFGDQRTTDRGVFSLKDGDYPCFGLNEVLARYNETVPNVELSGPTSFVPLINKAIEIVCKEKAYHILLILTDGQISDEKRNANAIIRASSYPLSIIVIGLGDADFSAMHEFDDQLPELQFDNFQFVNFNAIINDRRVENVDVEFAVAALQEIPDQWRSIQTLKLFNNI